MQSTITQLEVLRLAMDIARDKVNAQFILVRASDKLGDVHVEFCKKTRDQYGGASRQLNAAGVLARQILQKSFERTKILDVLMLAYAEVVAKHSAALAIARAAYVPV